MLTTIGAYAVRRSDPEVAPLLADSEATLNKVIALTWIAEWKPVPTERGVEVRRALLDERWGDAVAAWQEATDEVLDIFPHGISIHEARDYPDEEFGPWLQTKPLFSEAG